MGDSAEQNGSFNIASVVEKMNIMAEKEKVMYDRPTIESYDIIRIVNAAWLKSFSWINTNKKAIAARGWFPYNRALMFHPTIRASITKEEEELELKEGSKIVIPSHERYKIINLTNEIPTSNPRFTTNPIITTEECTPNFKTGVAAWCLDNIVQDQDLFAARSRIKKIEKMVSR